MHVGEVVITHVLSETASDGSSAALLLHAAAQLGVLSSTGQVADGSESVGELVAKARVMLSNKQAPIRKEGLELLACITAHCDRRTFLSGYQEWFTAAVGVLRGGSLQGNTQQQNAVQQAGWQCLTVLFDRIGRMLDIPRVRRDGAALVPKLVALLQQQFPAALAPAEPTVVLGSPAWSALLAAVTALPAPFRQHIKYLEPLVVATLMQPLLPPGPAMRLAAACTAALPRINGDGSSWGNMAQRLLSTVHGLLDVLLLGLDDQSLVGTARELLDPQAAPLPGLPSATSASFPAYKAAFGQLGAAIEALQALLTRSYPSPVPIPSTGLLLLVSRLTGVDDASGGPGKAGSSKFAELCLHLPALHAAALRLLCTLLCAAGAQLAPLYLTIARLLAGYLETVAAGGAGALTPLASQVRLQLYAATRLLLEAAGVGIARPLAPVLVHCARAELYGAPAGTAGSAGRQPEPQQGPARKKARKSKGQVGAQGLDGEDGLLGGPKNDDAGAACGQADLAAQAAMLGALEALLTRGAGLLPAAERSQADAIAGHMAATTAAAVQKLSQDAEGDASPLAPLHLASYRALLASVLAPLGHRPPLLPLALRLFRAGVTGGAGAPALAAWCQQALLSCEALLHPRSIPRPVPLRPLGTSGAGAGAGAYGFTANGTASLSAGMTRENTSVAGEIPLGVPMFWSYLDAGGDGQLAQQAQQAQQAGHGRAVEGLVAGQAAVQQQQQQAMPQQAQQAADGEDAMMDDAIPVQPVTAVQDPGLVTAQQGLSTGAAPQQVHVHQPFSSMAAMMGNGPSGGAVRVAAAVPQSALASVAPPQSAAAAAATGPAPLILQPAFAQPLQAPSAAAPTEPAGQEEAPLAAAAVTAAAVALAPSLAVAAGGESDSDGPLPEIDSGDEDSGGDSDENEAE